jgi:hypothetical protein
MVSYRAIVLFVCVAGAGVQSYRRIHKSSVEVSSNSLSHKAELSKAADNTSDGEHAFDASKPTRDCVAAVQRGHDISEMMFSLEANARAKCVDDEELSGLLCREAHQLKAMQEEMLRIIERVWTECETPEEITAMWAAAQSRTEQLAKTVGAKDLSWPNLAELGEDASVTASSKKEKTCDSKLYPGKKVSVNLDGDVQFVKQKLTSSTKLPPPFVESCQPRPDSKYQWDVLDVTDVQSSLRFLRAANFRVRPSSADQPLTSAISQCTFGHATARGQTTGGVLLAFNLGQEATPDFTARVQVSLQSKDVHSKAAMHGALDQLQENDRFYTVPCGHDSKLFGLVPLPGVSAKTIPLVGLMFSNETGAGKPCTLPPPGIQAREAPHGFLKAAEGELGVCAPLEDVTYYLHRLSCAATALVYHLEPPVERVFELLELRSNSSDLSIEGKTVNESDKAVATDLRGNSVYHPLLQGIGGVLSLAFKGPAYGLMITLALTDHIVAGFTFLVAKTVGAAAVLISLPAYPFVGRKRGLPGLQNFITGVLMAPVCGVAFVYKAVSSTFFMVAEVLDQIGNAVALSPGGRPVGSNSARGMFGSAQVGC